MPSWFCFEARGGMFVSCEIDHALYAELLSISSRVLGAFGDGLMYSSTHAAGLSGRSISSLTISCTLSNHSLIISLLRQSRFMPALSHSRIPHQSRSGCGPYASRRCSCRALELSGQHSHCVRLTLRSFLLSEPDTAALVVNNRLSSDLRMRKTSVAALLLARRTNDRQRRRPPRRNWTRTWM